MPRKSRVIDIARQRAAYTVGGGDDEFVVGGNVPSDGIGAIGATDYAAGGTFRNSDTPFGNKSYFIRLILIYLIWAALHIGSHD